MGNQPSGFKVRSNGKDLTEIFKFITSAPTQSTKLYSKKNGTYEDLNTMFEPATSNPNSQITYDTGYKYYDTNLNIYKDLRYLFMDINYSPITITPSPNYSQHGYISNLGVSYEMVVYYGDGPTNGNISVENAPSGYDINYLLIGAGGGGGAGSTNGDVNNYGGPGGGGGGGSVSCATFQFSNGTYNFNVPGKTEGENDGGATTFDVFYGLGGNRGNNGSGGNGGSGGSGDGNGGGGGYGYSVGDSVGYSGNSGDQNNFNLYNNLVFAVSGEIVISANITSIPPTSPPSQTYNFGGGGGGGASNLTEASGGTGAGGAGGTQCKLPGDQNYSGNGKDGTFGGGGGGGGGQNNVADYGAGNGGRGGSGFAMIWWKIPPS